MIPTCPYCGASARFLADSSSLYHGRDYGPVWACAPCGAWVGVHRGTQKPLGRLADKGLRTMKQKAHAAFDPLWQAKIMRDRCSRKAARGAGYAWLAERLGIPVEECHIGLFNEELCRRVIEICSSSFRVRRG